MYIYIYLELIKLNWRKKGDDVPRMILDGNPTETVVDGFVHFAEVNRMPPTADTDQDILDETNLGLVYGTGTPT